MSSLRRHLARRCGTGHRHAGSALAVPGTAGGAAPPRPVSQETLAGIPWAGRSTLTGLFQRVATAGPQDPAVWRKLLARAGVIAHSLTAQQAALILSAAARAQQRDEAFLRRFGTKFVPGLIQTAEVIDLCGIISSLSQLDVYCEETFHLAARRCQAAAAQMDLRQLSLLLNAFVRVGHKDGELYAALLRQLRRHLAKGSARDVALLLNALAQLPGLLGGDFANGGAALQEQLQAISLRLPALLPSADLHSLTLILNAFAQLQFHQKDALDLIMDELASHESRLERMTPRQLAMVLNAMAKLQQKEPQLLEKLLGRFTGPGPAAAAALDPQALSLTANAGAKLRLGSGLFEALAMQIPQSLPRFTGRQLAMLCHAWARARVQNDELFALLALPLAKQAGSLSAHEVALVAYGYAHFRKSPVELFEPLLQRFSVLLEAGEVGDLDLSMVSHALGKVSWQDSSVAAALEDRARDLEK